MMIEKWMCVCICFFLIGAAIMFTRLPEGLRGGVEIRLNEIKGDIYGLDKWADRVNKRLDVLERRNACIQVNYDTDTECTDEDIEQYKIMKNEEIIIHDKYLKYKENNNI